MRQRGGSGSPAAITTPSTSTCSATGSPSSSHVGYRQASRLSDRDLPGIDANRPVAAAALARLDRHDRDRPHVDPDRWQVRMSQVPPLNHWWHVPLYVSARGLTTSAMPFDDRAFEIAFDFVDHRLTAVDSRGRSFAFDLEPMSVAAFYRTLMAGLARIDIVVPIHPVPNEVKVAI